jgi:cytochrome c-type biogenesis protein CcmF
VLATRRQGWRGFVGRVNGGMIVHLGVVVVAVGFAASHSFAEHTQLSLHADQTAHFDGHTLTYEGLRTVNDSTHSAVEAEVRVDSGSTFAPAISDYPFAEGEIGTPSVDSRPTEDVYLTLVSTPAKATDPVVIGVIVEPLVSWVWIGGGIMVGGTLLSAFPGRRRRPTDPVSAPVVVAGAGRGADDPVGAEDVAARVPG